VQAVSAGLDRVALDAQVCECLVGALPALVPDVPGPLVVAAAGSEVE